MMSSNSFEIINWSLLASVWLLQISATQNNNNCALLKITVMCFALTNEMKWWSYHSRQHSESVNCYPILLGDEKKEKKERKNALQRWSHFKLLQSLPSFLSRGFSASFQRTMTHWFRKLNKIQLNAELLHLDTPRKKDIILLVCVGKCFFGNYKSHSISKTINLKL